MTDKSSIQQGIISGQLAGSTTSVSAAVLDTFNNASGIDILKADGYAPTMPYFNCEREPFNNAKFRQAISLGIDTGYHLFNKWHWDILQKELLTLSEKIWKRQKRDCLMSIM